jgi:outer membrane protein assembly factor BamE (lipoprotein component of BamABCDE complex)
MNTPAHDRSSLRLRTALALAVLLPGCLVGSSSQTDYSGRYLSEETIAEIHPGASKDFVLQLCGEPTARITADDGAELWKWEYRQQTTSSGGVFLLVGTSKSSKSEGAVWVKFDGDQVVRVWRDSPSPG